MESEYTYKLVIYFSINILIFILLLGISRYRSLMAWGIRNFAKSLLDNGYFKKQKPFNPFYLLLCD